MSTSTLSLNIPSHIHSIETKGSTMVFRFGSNLPVFSSADLPQDNISSKQLHKVFDLLKLNSHAREKIVALLNRNGKRRKKFSITEIGIMFATMPLFGATHAYAAEFNVDQAFNPLIEVIKDLANPICYIMFIIGFIYVMIGRASEGFKRMQYAAYGYIGMQLAPGLMTIIKNVGGQIAT